MATLSTITFGDKSLAPVKGKGTGIAIPSCLKLNEVLYVEGLKQTS